MKATRFGLGNAFGMRPRGGKKVLGCILAASFIGAATCPGASAQTILVHVLNAETSAPVVGALTYVVGVDGNHIRTTLTDQRGRALFVGIPDGRFLVRIEVIGMATAETSRFEVSEGMTVNRVLRAEPMAIELEGLDVELEADRCSVRPRAEGALVAEIWDEARKALATAWLTDDRANYRYETLKYERQMDRTTGVVVKEEQERHERSMKTPYESHPPEDLLVNGFVQDAGEEDLYMAPDASVMLSDAFLGTHCFHLVASRDGETAGLIGLGFRPTGENKSVPDISGTMWLDPETSELRWLEFTYEFLEPERTSPHVGGRVDFERLPSGAWIVKEWWIRMPIMGVQTDFRGRPLRYIERYQQTGGLVLSVRQTGGRSLSQPAKTGGIKGLVRDSLGLPLQGVRVGVLGANQEVFTNAEGVFSITGLPEGTYRVLISAPAFEDAGFTVDPVARDVIPGELSRLEYHLPSMTEILFDECRDVERAEGTVVLAGTVLDTLGSPVPEATVRVEWNGFDFSGVPAGRRATDLRRIPHVRETTTSSRGSYSFCAVPAESILLVAASTLSGQSSQELEFVIPEEEIGAVRVLRLSTRH